MKTVYLSLSQEKDDPLESLIDENVVKEFVKSINTELDDLKLKVRNYISNYNELLHVNSIYEVLQQIMIRSKSDDIL